LTNRRKEEQPLRIGRQIDVHLSSSSLHAPSSIVGIGHLFDFVNQADSSTLTSGYASSFIWRQHLYLIHWLQVHYTDD